MRIRLRRSLRGRLGFAALSLILVAAGVSTSTASSLVDNPATSTRAEKAAAREYLKQAPDGWVTVTRDDRTAAILARRAAAAPMMTRSEAEAESRAQAVPASAASPFLPYAVYPTGSWPEAVAIGDVNGDGRNDVVLVTSFYFDAANDKSLHVFIQDVDGTLKPRVVHYLGGDPQSVATGDVNGDGRDDVVVALDSGIGVLAQNALGTLDAVVLHATSDALRVKVVDLNHDGRQDVVGIGWGTNTASVLLQQADGSLGSPVVYSAQHAGYDDLEVADVNGDGLTDVIVMSGQLYAVPNFSILYQQPGGTLGGLVTRSVGVNQLAGGIGVGDVNGDAKNDVVVGMNWAGGGTPQIDVFAQQANGTLPASPTQALAIGYPEPVEVGELTGDGSNDVIAFDGSVPDLGLFRQSATGQLGAKEALAFPYATHLNRHGIAIGDISNDGADDVVVANYNYGLVVYRSTGPSVSTMVSIDDVTVTEGDSGTTTASFTVSLSEMSDQAVTVDYTTADDTATTAGGDYVASSGTLAFAPGVTTRPLTVAVNGDTLDEPNERFLVTLSNPAWAILSRARGLGTIIDDDGLGGPGSAMPAELRHGFEERRSLAALPGPVQEQHFFLLAQEPYSSYELAVDEISGDLQSLPAQPLAIDFLSASGIVAQAQSASPLGRSRSLRWMNRNGERYLNDRIRIRSGGCTTTCGAEDQYRLRFYETTYGIPRFNNTGGQTTVLILQNPTAEAVTGVAFFWDAAGTLVTNEDFSLAPGATLLRNTAHTPAAGKSGSVTIMNDAPYGALIGKAVALDAGTGYSFDSPMVARPH